MNIYVFLNKKGNKIDLFLESLAYNFLQMSFVPPEDFMYYTNQARTKPAHFAQYIKKELQTFLDNMTLPLKPGCNRSTFEGKAAWREAIDYLLKQQPIHPLKLNKGLCLAAQDHTADMIKTGVTGHDSSDGSTCRQRIDKRCGKSYGMSGQNISRDFVVEGRKHALTSVMKLIIDDGTSSRGHRKNIFNQKFNYVGSDTKIINGKVITVQDFHENNVGVDNNEQIKKYNGKSTSKFKVNDSMKTDDTLSNAVKGKNQQKNISHHIPSAQETLRYLNQARINPSQFAKYVKKQMDSFISGKFLPVVIDGFTVNMSTFEGKSAWQEAYNFLLKQKPLKALKIHKGMCQAAEDHALDMVKKNFFDHNSSDGTNFSKRIEKRCGKAFGMSGQNLGNVNLLEGKDNALQTILQLIIDDGVKSRGHRANIFNEKFNYVGIDSKIQQKRLITVQDFHSNIGDPPNPKPQNNNLGIPNVTKNNSTLSNAGSRLISENNATNTYSTIEQSPAKEKPQTRSINDYQNNIKVNKQNAKKYDIDNSQMDIIEAEMKKMGFKKGQFQIVGADPKKNGSNKKQVNLSVNKLAEFNDPFKANNHSSKKQNDPFKNSSWNQGGSTVNKRMVSQSINTKIKTCNGVKTKTKTTKIKYSDGTEEQIVEQTTEQVS